MKWRWRSVDVLPCQILEFFDAADDTDLAIFAPPDRDRRAPIAIAGDRPIARIFEPFAEPAVFDVLRDPMDLGSWP